MSKAVHIIGGGLAGCEAAMKVASYNIPVLLYDMKPEKKSEAHVMDSLGELVCSNSLKSNDPGTAAGLLKREMDILGSVCIESAKVSSVPAGGALAVDRHLFSKEITDRINNNPNITVINKEIDSLEKIPEDDIVIIATGPLTSQVFSQYIKTSLGQPSLRFFDAAAPIIYKDTIDMTVAFKAARYNKGTADYINCPMNKEQYLAFYNALVAADTADIHEFEEKALYEGCMPIESMAKRGEDTIRFGPLKPVGLDNPDGSKNYAVVQLRRDNTEDTLYNIVGFQTRLKFGEQKRVFSMIPGLENCEFARYGVMHRNTYIQSPGILDSTYKVINPQKYGWGSRTVFFAGQITGVEGYMESADSGIVAGINAAMVYLGKDAVVFPTTTATGALADYVSSYAGKDFQPMGINFGIIKESDKFAGLKRTKKNKKEHRALVAEDAAEIMKETAGRLNV